MRQVLATSGCLLSDEEVYALEKRYNDDMGFNYMWFLKEADPKEYIAPKVFSKHQIQQQTHLISILVQQISRKDD